jgi:type IV secretory pathway VirB10-like protein
MSTPVATPIQDKAPKPPGLMPKNVQMWVLLGLAFLMVVIMWLTGGKKAQSAPKSTTLTAQVPAPTEVNETKIAELQSRIQELQREQQIAFNQQNKVLGALQSENQVAAAAPVGTGANPQQAPPPDPIQAEKQRRAYASLFSSNVALSYRKELNPPQVPANPFNNEGNGSLLPQEPSLGQLSQFLQTLPPLPLAQNAPHSGKTTAEEAEENASKQKPAAAPVKTYPLNSAEGKDYVVFEGTVLETVLLNRLDGQFNGPVECLVSSDLYSHDRQHLLIPAGTKVLGEAKHVEAFGQTRLAVAFHRLIMPDGYSVSLDQFKGMNQIGDVGLRDQVNNHYVKIFGASLAVGAIGGIAEAGSGSLLTQSGTQTIQQGVGQSLGQTSQRILDKFLNILPTVTIREGHRVKIYLSGDLRVPDYANHKMSADL